MGQPIETLTPEQEADVRRYIGISEGKNKFDATAAPTVGDDSSLGYGVGSFWFDIVNDRPYVCVSATVGAAVWIRINEVEQVVTISETAPVNTNLPWLDPSSGIYSVWNGNAWVQTNGAGAGPTSPTNIVTPASPTTGQSVTGAATVDETHYVTPLGALNALTWNLPTSANSRVGQIKMFLSTQNITNLTVTVLGGGSKVGTALASAVANESYAYQCTSTSGAGTWLRIS